MKQTYSRHYHSAQRTRIMKTLHLALICCLSLLVMLPNTALGLLHQHHLAIPSKTASPSLPREQTMTKMKDNDIIESLDDETTTASSRRRDFLRFTSVAASAAVTTGGLFGGQDGTIAAAAAENTLSSSAASAQTTTYFQRFPTLFAPLYGESSRATIKRQVGENIWFLEQTLELGPLETPIRCVVIKLSGGTLWVHAPLAPTQEFFELVESCGGADSSSSSSMVAHVVVPTYALEHKIFTKDALLRWPNAKLWTAPGQFSFPWRSASDEYVWGRSVTGVLEGSDRTIPSSAVMATIPWTDEIEFETLAVGTFSIGGVPQTFYETAFYHKTSKTLIVTDAVEQVNRTPPTLNTPDNLLLVSKRSTADPQPDDTTEARQIGWEKTALLVSYFFPEHEEPDPEAGFGVVTWTDGWHDNFEALAGRLLVPPVVRTLLYPENPARVKDWVNRVSKRWNFEQIVPAHFEAPIKATPTDFERAFRFLEDDSIDAFPKNDLARGLKPIADVVYNSRLTK